MKVLLAQFRKPPVETRFHDRLGMALIRAGFNVHSAGAFLDVHSAQEYPVCMHPIFNAGTNRLLIFSNLLRLLSIILKENPALLIYSSPEISLLLPILKLLSPDLKIIFDIQENHSLNIQNQKHHYTMRFLSARLIDLLVRLGIKMADRIWLAEKIYQFQISLPSEKSQVIENKPRRFDSMDNHTISSENKFSFVGFISREAGILKAVDFIEILRQKNPDFRLQICGYCPDEKLRKELCGIPFIDYAFPDAWAGQDEIISCLRSSTAMLMPYLETDANAGKTPSKWFLAQSCAVPVIYNLGTRLNLPSASASGIAVDFSNPPESFAEIWQKFRHSFKPPEAFEIEYFNDEIILEEMFRLFGPDFSSIRTISIS